MNKKFKHVTTGRIVTAQKMGKIRYVEMILRLQQEGENTECYMLPDKKELIEIGLSFLEDNTSYEAI